MEESEGPGNEHTEQDGLPVKGRDLIDNEEENEGEEPTGPAQSTNEASISHVEPECEEPKSNEEYFSGPDKEDNDPDDLPCPRQWGWSTQ